MSHKKRFENELRDLFNRRTHPLTERLFSKKPGKPPAFSKKITKQKISVLQEILSDSFARRYARDEFQKCVYHTKA